MTTGDDVDERSASRVEAETRDRAEDARGTVDPLLEQRFSPTSFDSTHQLDWGSALLLVEAARWAPSAGNSQPWMFRPVIRGSEEHDVLLPLLFASSRTWASDASLVMLNIRRRFVDGSSLEYSDFSDYDLGQSVAHMTIQAQSMGLSCRQFRAFDHRRVTQAFGVPVEWELRTMTAVGRPADGRREPGSRRALGDLISAAGDGAGPGLPRG
jgi:hypothetical protein